jgi:folate-binding protein YgfZ
MVNPVSLDRERLSRLRDGAVLVRRPAPVIEVHGPGALACLQGLLSNDLVQPGDNTATFCALLTPKGMIIADLWVFRLSPERLVLLGDQVAHAAVLEVFRRSIPNRLAKVEDRSGELQALWLHGDLAIAALAAAAFSVPDGESRVRVRNEGKARQLLARPHGDAPFRAVLLAVPPLISDAVEALAQAGVIEGDETDHEAARILAGWPRLGAEILEKTLPQEVRLEELQGVSYTKGCYVGQETVARLHFRGHTNRTLWGLLWGGAPNLANDQVQSTAGADVGSVGSALLLPDQALGLALLRREVNSGDVVEAGGQEARVVNLPFELEARAW